MAAVEVVAAEEVVVVPRVLVDEEAVVAAVAPGVAHGPNGGEGPSSTARGLLRTTSMFSLFSFVFHGLLNVTQVIRVRLRSERRGGGI